MKKQSGLTRALTAKLYGPYSRFFRKGGTVPLHLIFHLITLTLATCLIFTHVNEVSRLKRRARTIYSSILYPRQTSINSKKEEQINSLSDDIDLAPHENLGLGTYYIISSAQLVRDTNLLVQRFFSLTKEYVGCAHSVCKRTMSGHAAVTKYKNSSAFDRSSPWHYLPLETEFKQEKLSMKDQGLPKNMILGKYWNEKNQTVNVNEDLLAWIEKLVFLDINLAIVTDDISDPFGRYVLRTAYTLRVKYSTTNRGEVTVTLEPRLHEFPLSLCFPEKEQEEEVSLESFTTRKGGDSDDINIGIYMSGNVILIILCMISAILYQIILVRDISDSCKLWNAVTIMKGTILRAGTSFNYKRSTCWSKNVVRAKVFNLSVICGTLGNVCLVMYGFMYLIHVSGTNVCAVSSTSTEMLEGDDKANFVLACSVMLLWFDVLQYFVYGPEGGNLRTIQRSAFKVGQVVIFVCPIYIGFVIFGVSTFGGQAPQFETFSSTSIVLFATLNGDEVRQTYTAIQQDCTDCASPVIGWVYMSAWLCFAMYVVLNIVIAIIEDVYMTLREIPSSEGGKDRTIDELAFDQVLSNFQEKESRGLIKTS